VRGSFLEGAPVFRLSAQTGQGIDGLKKGLAKLAAKVSERDERAVARLPIDRVFTIKGFGTVVTGTLVSGRIRSGDELDLLPSTGRRARARGLQVYGQAVREAKAGERTAVNLQGLEVGEIERGQVLAPAGRLHAGSMLDVRLQLLRSAPRPLRNRSRTHLHIGTAEALARVVLLGVSGLAPGDSAFAQLRLETPILALPGDHFIIRSYSPAATIGGGIVIDASPHKHRLREGALACSQLEKLAAADETERIALFLEMSGELGMSHAEIAARSGSTDEAIKRAAEALEKSRRAVVADRQSLLLIARPAFEGLAKQVTVLLKEFHRRSPLASGMGREELRERVFAHLPQEIFRTVIGHLTDRKEVAAEKDLLRLSTHRVALTPEEEAAKEHLAGIYARASLQPISLEDAIAQSGPQFGIDAGRAQRFAQMLISSGELVRVSDLIFHRSALESLRAVMERFKAEKGPRIDVAAFKDLTGVSRKYAIPLLEYLDRQRVTRRIGDVREIL
jgi:selenocysteine-specific elongation factor